MKIAVCEDNKTDAAQIVELLEHWMRAQRMAADIAVFESGEALLAAWTPGKYSILFMDIYLGTQNGIDICRTIRKSDRSCALVLTTVSVDHGLDGFAVDAVHYLLKPVRREPFCEAMTRCSGLWEQQARYLEFSESRMPVRVPLRDIHYIEVYRNNSMIHTQERDYNAYATLDSLLEQLQSSTFLRCHRSYAVNLRYVDRFGDNAFLLKTGTGIPVSRTYRPEAQKRWDKFIGDIIHRNRSLQFSL